MSGAAEILVIILAIVLAIFLILSIVLTVLLIKVTRQIKSVTNTAESAVNKLNSAAANVSKFSSPMILGKLIISQFKKYRR